MKCFFLGSESVTKKVDANLVICPSCVLGGWGEVEHSLAVLHMVARLRQSSKNMGSFQLFQYCY